MYLLTYTGSSAEAFVVELYQRFGVRPYLRNVEAPGDAARQTRRYASVRRRPESGDALEFIQPERVVVERLCV